MNVIERQMKLSRELFELNTSTMQRLFQVQSEGVRQYVDTSQAFAKRLPEVNDVSAFVELQRDYGQTLWNDAQDNLREVGNVLREAVETTSSSVREAFSGSVEDVQEAMKGATAA